MALRNQPYLPLYVQDFMTDEKLAECSAQATGVYIRIMCLMHKSETYGKVLLKQKHKQTDKQIKNFALMVARNLPYTSDVVLLGLEELLLEGVLQIEGDYLVQKRMVKDNDISEKRSVSGKLGGEKTKLKTNKFAQAKVQANTEYEIEYENENVNDNVSISDITDFEIGKTIEFVRLSGGLLLTFEQVKNFWLAFIIHAQGEVHKNASDKIQHFRNWLKKQKINQNAKLDSSRPNRIREPL